MLAFLLHPPLPAVGVVDELVSGSVTVITGEWISGGESSLLSLCALGLETVVCVVGLVVGVLRFGEWLLMPDSDEGEGGGSVMDKGIWSFIILLTLYCGIPDSIHRNKKPHHIWN